MKGEKVKQRFTRAEVVTALAAAYRVEQEKYHDLADSAKRAVQQGEAAEYSRLDAAAQVQEWRMNAMMKMVDALGIETAEFMGAVNREGA